MNKKLVVLFSFVFSATTIFSQPLITASTGKMGPFKLQMVKKDIEALTAQKIVLNFAKDVYQTDVKVKYKDVDFILSFGKSYSDAATTDSAMLLTVRTADNRVKTLSGLGVGNTKNDLLNVYSDKYEISIFSVYEENKKTGTWEKVPGKRRFNISDSETGAQLFFILINNIVAEIGLEFSEGD